MNYKDDAAKNNWLILIILVGLVLRLIDIDKPFSGLGKWNEGHYAVTALNYFKYGFLTPMNEYGLDVTTTPLYSWFIYLSIMLFGVHEWAARLPALFFGISSLILLYCVVERLYEKKTALASTFIAAVSPGIVYFSRTIQLESMFTAFAIAALLFLIYYKETTDGRWLTASGLYLSIAILTKYPAILVYPSLIITWFWHGKNMKVKKTFIRLFLYLILPLIPPLLWLFYAISTKPSLTAWYFSKPEAPWSLSNALLALYLALTRYLPEHFGYIFYIAFILTFPLILKELKRHLIVLFFTFSWLLLIFAFPDFYLSNMYYHYTMLYGMAILLGHSTAVLAEMAIGPSSHNLKKILTLTILLTTALSLYQYNIYFHSYYTNFADANETAPFQSAKYVASINTYNDLVVADLPMTMFYLGGDPEYIRLAYTTQGLINAVKEYKYTYLVTYYAGNRTLRETLEEYNYTQIAPRAWKKAK